MPTIVEQTTKKNIYTERERMKAIESAFFMIYRLLIRKGYYFKLLFFHLIFFFSLSLFFCWFFFIFMVSLSILLISHCRINNGCFHKRFVYHHFLKQFLLLKSNEITKKFLLFMLSFHFR